MDLKKILTKPKRKYYQWKFSFYPNNTVLCSSFLILKFSDMDAAAFLEDLKSKVHPEAIVGHDTVFHFDITGDSPTQKTIQIADGKLEVFDGLVGDLNAL